MGERAINLGSSLSSRLITEHALVLIGDVGYTFLMAIIYFDIYTVNCIKYKWWEFVSLAKNNRCYFTDKKAFTWDRRELNP
jgi:3-isopropylmalate dehydratase small subunit